MEESKKVLDVLKKADTPLKAAEIAEISGIDKAVVSKCIKQLKKEELINSPKFCYYTAN